MKKKLIILRGLCFAHACLAFDHGASTRKYILAEPLYRGKDNSKLEVVKTWAEGVKVTVSCVSHDQAM